MSNENGGDGLVTSPVAQIAKDLGINESGLRRWMAQSEVNSPAPRGGMITLPQPAPIDTSIPSARHAIDC